jgi:2-polyprenyl-6-hydroxyphenyl methylase/3-demethylubiquinone-9 3-methyltransferase
VGIGSSIRHRLGAFEVPVSNAYRSFFINLDDFAEMVRSVAPAERILEVGCGDGSLVQRLAGLYPEAEVLGIDISAEPGRLFDGDRSRVSFRSILTGDLLAEQPLGFDLVVICDVVHHVPHAQRAALLTDARALLRPGGHLVVKDWEPTRTLAHGLAYFSDTYVSGDTVAFPTRSELRSQLAALLPDDEIVAEARVPPRRNNFAVVVRRAAD